MGDGIYQSAITFFMGYLLFQPARFETSNGRGVADRERMGVFVACQTIVIVNTYVMLNSYLWNWLFIIIVVISTSLIWAWTGIYTSFTASFQFYKAGSEVYGQLSFWALTLVTVVICLLPRFSIKFFQKNFRPYDVDIVREQVRQGKFKYLDNFEAYIPPKAIASSGTSSSDPEQPTEFTKPINKHTRAPSVTESQRPLYPPSEVATSKHNPRSQNGSDGTDVTGQSTYTPGYQRRPSSDRMDTELDPPPNARPSLEQVRSSFERTRQSMDKLRPSIEASRDFTSAAQLARIESSYSQSQYSSPVTPVQSRRLHDITSDLRR